MLHLTSCKVKCLEAVHIQIHCAIYALTSCSYSMRYICGKLCGSRNGPYIAICSGINRRSQSQWYMYGSFFFMDSRSQGTQSSVTISDSIFWLYYIDVWLSVKMDHDVFKNCVFGGLMEATGRQDLRQSHSGQVKDPFAASCQTMGESELKNMWWRSCWLRVTVWLVSIQPQTDHDNHLTGGGLIM